LKSGGKNMKKKFYSPIAIVAVLFLTFGFAGSGSNNSSKDIVDTAVAAGTFNTLVAAVKAAGLVDVLKGEGPFTVFAPNDDAFAKLPAGTIESLLKDKEKLTAILTYHVVPGKYMASDVVSAHHLKTVQGQNLTVDTSSGVKIDSAKVIATDIETSNGVIHVIDSVVLPK
jgi:uncharacterized surface protein with fasciclin (FAS1) repeats